ncbi:hypothetical protein [Actinomadura napierensis]|uniref:Lipoprotein n=1 Tax=Actinomadura napierensis TaxID=267854 RepID=A0ABN3A5N4_9ACTN
MPRLRLALALGAAALVMATSSCNSDDAKAGGSTGKATTGATTLPAPSKSGSQCPTDKIPLPDGATLKNKIESAEGCLTYTINMTVTDQRGSYENAMAKVKAAGYEIKDPGREPTNWSFEAVRNEASPWSVITYVFADDHSVQILAELRH